MSEVIPNEAIEAAADVIGSLRLGDRQKFLTEAQLILEAAAPHMLAQGWAEGFEYGVGREHYDIDNNPYTP